MTPDTPFDHAFRNVARLSNDELKSQLVALVQQDRRVTAELLVHLGEVDARRLHACWAFSSLFRYAVESLGFSEDEAYRRITAARVVRKFPAALDLVVAGKLHLSGLLVVAPRLTRQNHVELLGAACGKTKRQVERLVAERFLRPDVPASVRRLPVASPDAAGGTPKGRDVAAATANAVTTTVARSAPWTTTSSQPYFSNTPPFPAATQNASASVAAQDTASSLAPLQPAVHVALAHKAEEPPAQELTAPKEQPLPPPPTRAADRPRVEPLAPQRYRVTFTASAELVEKLERAQELASHAVPPRDIAALVERALDALIAREEKRRYAAKPTRPGTSSGRRRASSHNPASQLAPERVFDEPSGSSCPEAAEHPRDDARESRYVPAQVRRGVSERDGGRCTFVDPETGRRCSERRFLDFEHIEPHALGGPPTLANMTLRCRAHNALAARRVFGQQYIAAAVTRGRGELVSNE